MPTTTREHLLHAVLANPDDDAPRLVYADTLQTEGDPRGELIAVQCELARLGCDRAERLYVDWFGDELADDTALDNGQITRLRNRAVALLKEHGSRWSEEVLPRGIISKSARFWRGFVEQILWDHRVKVPGGFATVMARAPISSIMPTGLENTKELDTFLRLPELDRIREIYNAMVCEVGLVPFAESPLPGLRRLLLAHTGGPHELAVLPRAAWVPRLTALVLNGFSVGVPDIAPLCARAEKLEELQLVDTRLGAAAFAAVAELPHVERLRILGVRHGRLGPSDAAPILRNAKLAEGLLALDLRTNKLGGVDTKPIGEGFRSLRVLNLGHNPLDKDAIAKLVGGGGLGKLRALAMEKSNIDDALLGAIAKSPLMPQLRSLDLRKNAITDTGAAALLRAKDLSALRTLYLGGNKLTAAGKKRLKESKELAGARLYL